MKQVVEAYATLWVIMIMLMLALAFTSINMNTAQARKILADIKSEVQASNGAVVPSDTNHVEAWSDKKLADRGWEYGYTIERQTIRDYGSNSDSETFIYNSIYKIKLEYKYSVPLFGVQVYPLETFAY